MSRVTKVSKRVRGDQLVLLTAERQTEQLARLVPGSEPDGWEGKTILDVGAWSRLRSLWFKGAEGPGAFHHWLAPAG